MTVHTDDQQHMLSIRRRKLKEHHCKFAIRRYTARFHICPTGQVIDQVD